MSLRLRLDEFRNAETTAEHLGSSPALKKGNEPRKMSAFNRVRHGLAAAKPDEFNSNRLLHMLKAKRNVRKPIAGVELGEDEEISPANGVGKAEEKNISNANKSGTNDAMEAFQGGLNLIRAVQVMSSLKRLPIGLELFLAAIRSVRLINRLSKSPKVIQSLKNMFDDEPLVTLDAGINFL